MSDHLIEELDVEILQEAIREEYAEVASDPEKGFHFHTGRPWPACWSTPTSG